MPKGNPGQTKEFLPNYSLFIGNIFDRLEWYWQKERRGVE